MKNKKNIIIIGMPGSGKTTFGQALAKRMGRDFYDADDVIVAQEGKSIPELFAVSEDCFRDAEVRASKTLAAKEGTVVACDVSTRPLLKDGKQKVYDLYDERIALYRNAADYRVLNDKTIEEVLDAFSAIINDIK